MRKKPMQVSWLLISALVILAMTLVIWVYWQNPSAWNEQELADIRSLWINNLEPLPSDPTNTFATHKQAQSLGHKLFFDPRLSGNGAVSCATCHQPQHRFTDQLAVSRAIGTSARNAPSLIGVAYSPWLYWDGRKDSLWSQALAPLEDAAEHGGNRSHYVHLIASDATYRADYEAIFGPLEDLSNRARFPADAGPVSNEQWQSTWLAMHPKDREIINRIFANIGKAIAAYESLLLPGPSPFDAYVESLSENDSETTEPNFTATEKRGLRLFIGTAGCTQCHNGPLLTNNSFHNTGPLTRPGTTPDKGRAVGLRKLQKDPFNCLGSYSDNSNDCLELRFARSGAENIGATRTPSLRNLEHTQPYAHAGQQATLNDVLTHYDLAPDAMIGHNEAKPLQLWPWEIHALEAFLLTLAAPPATKQKWLQPPTD